MVSGEEEAEDAGGVGGRAGDEVCDGWRSRIGGNVVGECGSGREEVWIGLGLVRVSRCGEECKREDEEE